MKICVVTGSRAEYGLLYWLMKGIQLDNDFDLQIIITGMHLSQEYGNTYRKIEEDGFLPDKKLDILLSSNTGEGVGKSIGLGVIGFSDSLSELRPDLLVILGDRFEIFSAATAATVMNIPIVHLHGGEVTQGSFDESMRHSITKMSHLHFVATEEYRKRVIQLGECPSRVFNVGGLGIENINKLKLLSETSFEDETKFNLLKRNILVTYHPVTLEPHSTEKQFQELLDSLCELNDTGIIFTKSNSDPGGKVINNLIDDFVKNHTNSVSFISLGQIAYLSALQFVDIVMGNSSSGLIEAPSFGVATINIGNRQEGRIKAASVIDCLPEKKSISEAIKKAFSADFRRNIQGIKNPYGYGNASSKIIKIIKKHKLDDLLKKQFYDL